MTFWKIFHVHYPLHLKLESYLILEVYLETKEIWSGSICKVILLTVQIITCIEKNTRQRVSNRLGCVQELLCDLGKSLVFVVFQ